MFQKLQQILFSVHIAIHLNNAYHPPRQAEPQKHKILVGVTQAFHNGIQAYATEAYWENEQLQEVYHHVLVILNFFYDYYLVLHIVFVPPAVVRIILMLHEDDQHVEDDEDEGGQELESWANEQEPFVNERRPLSRIVVDVRQRQLRQNLDCDEVMEEPRPLEMALVVLRIGLNEEEEVVA